MGRTNYKESITFYMRLVASGKIKKPGLSKEQAKEHIQGQKPSDFKKRKKKLADMLVK